MKDFELINTIADLQKQYHEGAATLSETQKKEIADKMKSYRVMLAEMLAMGAEVCPDCGEKPIGMRRAFGVIEVGCACPPAAIEDQGRTRRISHSAQGYSVDEAVHNWNNKNFIIDDKPL